MSDVKRWEPENTFLGYNMKPTEDGSFVLFEEFDAHAARLQAEVEELKNNMNNWMACAAERLQMWTDSQSELTKARELLTDAMNILIWDENGTPGVNCAVKISQFLAHQSAPAAKD